MYDPALARWHVPDPLAEVSRRWSPYSYCYNNPLQFTDPDGMRAEDFRDNLDADPMRFDTTENDDWRNKNGEVIEGAALKNVKAYIFYDGTAFDKQASAQYDEAVSKYGEGAVALSDTGSNEGFAQDWADMDGKPSEVTIIMHGKNQSVNVNSELNSQITSTGDGKTNISGSDAMNVGDLARPKADLSETRLNMYSCHSTDRKPQAHGKGDHKQGALKGTMQPIADAFATNFGFKDVKGTSGSVNFNRLNYNPYPQNGRWIYLDKKNGQ